MPNRMHDVPPPFRVGAKTLSARELNQLREKGAKLLTGAGPVMVQEFGDRSIIGHDKREILGGPIIQNFFVLYELDDVLVCEAISYESFDPQIYDEDVATASGIIPPGTVVNIAKPWILQKTPWDGKTVTIAGVAHTYNYNVGVGKRSVTVDGTTTVESIDVPYFVGDIIKAARGPTGYSYGPGPSFNPVMWIDINCAAREWEQPTSNITDITINTISVNYNDTTVSTTTNNYDTGGKSKQRINASAGGAVITGLAGGRAGQIMIIWNVGAFPLVLSHQSLLSLAANRVITPLGADYTIWPGGGEILEYDGVSLRWRFDSPTYGVGNGAGLVQYGNRLTNFSTGLAVANNGDGSVTVTASGTTTNGVNTVNFDTTQPTTPATSIVCNNDLGTARFGRIHTQDQGAGVALFDWQGFRIYLSGTGLVGPEPDIELVPGAGIGITVVDDVANERIKVTITNTAPAAATAKYETYFRTITGSHAGDRWYLAGEPSNWSNNTGALTTDTIYALPFLCNRGGATIDKIAFFLSLNFAGNVRIGIYDNVSDTDLYPGNLLFDSGNINCNAGAPVLKTAAAGLAAGVGKLYWFVLLSDVGTMTSILGVNPALCWPILGIPNAWNTAPGIGWIASFAFAALPATYPAGATLLLTSSPAAPAVGAHYSA